MVTPPRPHLSQGCLTAVTLHLALGSAEFATEDHGPGPASLTCSHTGLGKAVWYSGLLSPEGMGC